MEPGTSISVESTPIMSLRNISKYFGGVQALTSVDVDIYSGTVVALVGDNGAGKSTFLKVISGVNIPEEGTITYKSEPAVIRSTFDSINLGIQTVYQDLALCDNLDIVQNLFLGREITDAFGRLDVSEMEHKATTCLEELGIEIADLHTKVGELSGGQRQTIAIARAMLGTPDIVLLDEPLANLGVKQREQVGKLILNLRERSVAVVVVSHDLAEVFAVCDQVIVFRLGEKVAEFDRAHINKKDVIAEITGSRLYQEAQVTT